MKLRSLLSGAWALRAIARELRGIREELHTQNSVLTRVAALYLPPLTTDAPRAATAQDTGVSFLDTLEAGIVEDYIARTTHDTGRAPSDEEILTFLADEKTIDLHLRLKTRAQEIAERTRPSEP